MEARMKNPAALLPDAMKAIQGLYAAAYKGGMPVKTLELVHLRASQINGCAACVFAGSRSARKAGESDDRLASVAVWREAPWFSAAERAALALTESATRLADRGEGVPDAIWDEALRHYEEPQLASLVLWIAMTNFFNRINVTIREPAGATWG